MRNSVSTEINGQGEVVEKVIYDHGIFTFLKDHPFPYKGLPSVAALDAINVAKLVLKEYLRHPFFNYKKLALTAITPHLLPLELMTPTAQEVRKMVGPYNAQISLIISHILEYDAAYRFRLQDLATESSETLLTLYPQWELRRLKQINRERDYNVASAKIGKLMDLLIWALYWPPFRKKFVKAVRECNFSNLQFDENDRYWASLKRDYKYFGHEKEKAGDENERHMDSP